MPSKRMEMAVDTEAERRDACYLFSGQTQHGGIPTEGSQSMIA
jgi:hypothetical protein